jgi:hypothetical protein
MTFQSGRGRGRGRFSGKGGCSSQGRSSQSKPTQKKTITDYKYALGGGNGTISDFNEVAKYLLNHIQKTYAHGGDIQAALKDRKEFNFKSAMPQQRFSSATQEAEKKVQDTAYEAVFKAQIQQFVKREDSYVSNKGKVYALLWQQCTRTMQDKIHTIKLAASDVSVSNGRVCFMQQSSTAAMVCHQSPCYYLYLVVTTYISLKC